MTREEQLQVAADNEDSSAGHVPQSQVHDRVAIYDVDRTITRLPTFSRFLLQSMAYRNLWRVVLIPLLVPLALVYALRLLPRRHMKQAMQWVALGSAVPRKEAEMLGDMFAQELFADGLYPEAMAQIERDRAQGWLVMLATAAPDLYIVPLARRLGIADVVATRSHWTGSHLSCRIDGDNCYGASKLQRIQQALDAKGIDRSRVQVRFYSDHESDRDVCEWADEPVAVNPSQRMAALARRKGWRLLDWRAP